jgi:hypothetical protein
MGNEIGQLGECSSYGGGGWLVERAKRAIDLPLWSVTQIVAMLVPIDADVSAQHRMAHVLLLSPGMTEYVLLASTALADTAAAGLLSVRRGVSTSTPAAPTLS